MCMQSQDDRITTLAVVPAVDANTDRRMKVLGIDVGASEAENFWTGFLEKLTLRGLHGLKIVTSDAHVGIKAAVAKLMHATWQRCRLHFMCNALTHASKGGKRVVSAFIGSAFAQEDAKSVKAEWRRVSDQ